jgi:hypothetical protein
LVVFSAVEKGDENVEEVCEKLIKEIVGVSDQLKCKNILLHPWVHLTSNPSSPKVAQEVLLKTQSKLNEKGFVCDHSPFGWYKAFNIKSKGHPLSELSRQIGGFVEGYGASHTLQEMLTIKSDDVVGRSAAFEAIIRGQEIKKPNLPASFNVLLAELKSLGLNVTYDYEKRADESKSDEETEA